MGGDHGPSVTLPACKAFLDSHPDAELLLVGSPGALAPATDWPRCTLITASQVVTMDDTVETALRKKRDSSMRVAIEQLKADEAGAIAADVCVSAGNTGALMAVSRYLLKTMDGIDRPAIAAFMPNMQGPVHLRARSRRQRRLQRRAPAAVRRDGQRAGHRHRGPREAGRRPAQHRRGSDQGQRGHQARGRAAARGRGARPPQLPTATSRATTSSRARPTSWSATASSATSRSRATKAWPR